MRVLSRAFCALFFIMISLLAACEPNGPSLSPSQMDFLVLRLESKYKREIDNNDYSLHYYTRGDDAVIIEMNHYPSVPPRLITSVTQAAKDLVTRLASELYGMKKVKIDIEIHEVPRPDSKKES